MLLLGVPNDFEVRRAPPGVYIPYVEQQAEPVQQAAAKQESQPEVDGSVKVEQHDEAPKVKVEQHDELPRVKVEQHDEVLSAGRAAVKNLTAQLAKNLTASAECWAKRNKKEWQQDQAEEFDSTAEGSKGRISVVKDEPVEAVVHKKKTKGAASQGSKMAVKSASQGSKWAVKSSMGIKRQPSEAQSSAGDSSVSATDQNLMKLESLLCPLQQVAKQEREEESAEVKTEQYDSDVCVEDPYGHDVPSDGDGQ
jgi:hypothetical protein